MKKMKKVLSLVLAMAMILSLGATPVQAAGREQSGWSSVTYGAAEDKTEETAEVPAEEPATVNDESEVPAEEPAASAEESEVPAEEPAAPAEESEIPAEEPAAPAEEPAAPAEEPAAPAAEPEVPAAEPAAPAENVVSYPAVTLAGMTEGSVAVRVEAPEGALPEGTTMTLKDVTAEEVQAKVSDEIASRIITAVDITFCDLGNNEVQPNGNVSVFIKAPEIAEAAAEDLGVLHINEEKQEAEELTEAENAVQVNAADENAVAFENDAFSIYAVVDTGEYARLTVNFVANGKTTTMYVKKKDVTDGKLEQVLYDPGVPVVERKKFMGWTDVENDTTLSAGMTIGQVRSNVAARLNAGITDGDTVTFYAKMVTSFELYYQDEFENTYKTENLLTAGNSATTTVNQNYTVQAETATRGFIGWVVKGTEEPVYKNGSQITISADTTLVPKIGEGKWIHFDENDGGSGTGNATYTAPKFVPAGEDASAYEPDDPTRPGYTFAGWYKGAADSAEKYEFNTDLSEFTGDEVTLYAHWTPNAHASYKVIIWKQKVTDDKNAADANKTYDYLESYTIENVATDTPITAEALSQYLYYGNAKLGVTDLEHGSYGFKTPARFEVLNGSGSDKNGVSADNSTIVNVYYDRALFSLRFVGTSGGTVSYIPSGNGTNVYGLVNGEYVPLTVTVSNKRIVWSREAGNLALPDSITQVKWATKVGLLGEADTVNVSGLYYYGTKLIDQAVGATGTQASTSSGYNGTRRQLFTTTSSNVSNYCQLRWTIAGDYSYTYNGEPYEGQLFKQTTEIVYTGLYGQSFKDADPSYTWIMPDSTHHWEHVSYLDAFTGNLYGHTNVGGTPNTIAIEKSDDTSNIITLVIWEQNTNLSGYTKAASAKYSCVSTDGFNITERVQGMTPTGYRWSTSESMPSTWNSAATMNSTTDGVNAEGYTNVKRGSNTVLHVKNDRVTNDIVFMYGSQEVGRTEGIAYGVSLAGYQNTTPDASTITIPENQYFAGWYDNPEGVGDPYDWSETMPLGNKLIYAVTKPVEYHVVVEMDGGEVPGQQRLSFWVPYGTVLDDTNFMNATKEEDGSFYSLVGYYTDEAYTKLWNFTSRITAESLWYTYTGPDDPARAEYDDENYDQTVGIFKLFARWRNDDILGKGGLHIRYKNPTGARTYEYTDPLHYADLVDVITAQAPTEEYWPEGKRFDGWQLKAGSVYQPGDIFVADSRDSVIENNQYWITLTATYVDKEDRTPTHITWYRNDGSTGDAAILATTDNHGINEPWDIYGTKVGGGYDIPTRAGYEFLGWAKDVEKQTATDPVNYSTTKTTPDFLVYDAENNQYKYGDKVVTQVAADEVLPYEGLYAIWEKKAIYIFHSSDGTLEALNEYDDSLAFENLVKGDNLYGGCYTAYGAYAVTEADKAEALKKIGQTDKYYDTAAPDYNGSAIRTGLKLYWQKGKIKKASDSIAADSVYYLKEVPKTYLDNYTSYVYDKDTKAIEKLYFITAIDDNSYSGVFFKVSVNTGDGKSYTTTISNKLSFVPIKGGTSLQLDPNSTFGLSTVNYLAWCDGAAADASILTENATITVQPYWVTLDNVTMYGKTRTLNMGDCTINETGIKLVS